MVFSGGFRVHVFLVEGSGCIVFQCRVSDLCKVHRNKFQGLLFFVALKKPKLYQTMKKPGGFCVPICS